VSLDAEGREHDSSSTFVSSGIFSSLRSDIFSIDVDSREDKRALLFIRHVLPVGVAGSTKWIVHLQFACPIA
jgi:hypothetical protein